MEYISWNEAKGLDSYYYSGNKDTPNQIANIFQQLSTNEFEDKRDIVNLQYGDYICELDIFWEEIGIKNIKLKLVIELFVTHNNEIINNSGELLISNIYKPDYLEKEMYNFIMESI